MQRDPQRRPRHSTPLLLTALLLLLLLATTACRDEQASGEEEDNTGFGFDVQEDFGGGEPDGTLEDEEIGAPDAPDDTPEPDDAAEEVAEDAPEDSGVDAFLEDGFDRPDIGPEVNDEPIDTSVRLEGTNGCLWWQLEAQATTFTLKEDDIFVSYEVRNTCNRPIRVRAQHFSDFLPVGIQKNGEDWIFLPDCPGTGDPYEYSFTLGSGLRRGWFWQASAHQAQLDACGVEFDRDAQYQIIGYGLTELPANDFTSWSELYILTEPIPIRLNN